MMGPQSPTRLEVDHRAPDWPQSGFLALGLAENDALEAIDVVVAADVLLGQRVEHSRDVVDAARMKVVVECALDAKGQLAPVDLAFDDSVLGVAFPVGERVGPALGHDHSVIAAVSPLCAALIAVAASLISHGWSSSWRVGERLTRA